MVDVRAGTIEQRVSRLQAQVRASSDALKSVDPHDAGYTAATQRMVETTAALVDFEAKIPQLRRRAKITHRRHVIGTAGWVLAASAAGYGAAGIAGAVSVRWPWILLLISQLVIGFGVGIDPPGATAKRPYLGVGILMASGLLVFLLSRHVLPGVFTLLALAGFAAGAWVLAIPDTSEAAR